MAESTCLIMLVSSGFVSMGPMESINFDAWVYELINIQEELVKVHEESWSA